MLTKLTIRNFKRFEDVEIALGNPVVFIGPNNSGKTSAMQALTLLDLGLRRWREKYADRAPPVRRPGVTINRKDLFAIPHYQARHLWRNCRVKEGIHRGGKTRTTPIRIEIEVEGIDHGKVWECGLEFDYANEESFYCRPLRLDDSKHPERMPIPEAASSYQVAYLPPMSGLAANETRLDPGAIDVRIGDGRTAEVLRNLCYHVATDTPDHWEDIIKGIDDLFGATLHEPTYVAERGEIKMAYQEHGIVFDLSSAGRGLQQTLLILAYMYMHPKSIILFDEPDAHLEILRQRQIYRLISEIARDSGSQIVAASHSEVLLREAVGKDTVIAFVGRPHLVEGKTSDVRKVLNSIGFDQYYQAMQTGWVLYLEGNTDLAILQAFASRLGKKDVEKVLARPFVKYVGNQPSEAMKHFFGLKEAVPDLQGIAVFDRLDQQLPNSGALSCRSWTKREIENYLCTPATVMAYARETARKEAGPLSNSQEEERRTEAMRNAIDEVSGALATLGLDSPWHSDTKVSDNFLTPLFKQYYKNLSLPNRLSKKSFHELAMYVPTDEINQEIAEVLDAIALVAESAAVEAA